jgi:hypothetical protein
MITNGIIKIKNLLLIILFYFLPSVNSYTYYRIINTSFKTNNDITKFLINPDFYNRYLDIIEAEKILFTPSINNCTMINLPQTITYYSRPNMKFIPNYFPKIKIVQQWNKIDNTYYGKVKTKYMDVKLLLEPLFYDNFNFYKLKLEAEIIRKESILIPNSCLNDIIEEFCDIFKIIYNNY